MKIFSKVETSLIFTSVIDGKYIRKGANNKEMGLIHPNLVRKVLS